MELPPKPAWKKHQILVSWKLQNILKTSMAMGINHILRNEFTTFDSAGWSTGEPFLGSKSRQIIETLMVLDPIWSHLGSKKTQAEDLWKAPDRLNFDIDIIDVIPVHLKR